MTEHLSVDVETFLALAVVALATHHVDRPDARERLRAARDRHIARMGEFGVRPSDDALSGTSAS